MAGGNEGGQEKENVDVKLKEIKEPVPITVFPQTALMNDSFDLYLKSL